MSVQIVPSTLHSGSLDQLNDLRGLEGCGTHFLMAALSCSVWAAVGPPPSIGGGGGPGGPGGSGGGGATGGGGGGGAVVVLVTSLKSDTDLLSTADSRCLVSLWHKVSVSSFSLVRAKFASRSSLSCCFRSSSCSRLDRLLANSEFSLSSSSARVLAWITSSSWASLKQKIHHLRPPLLLSNVTTYISIISFTLMAIASTSGFSCISLCSTICWTILSNSSQCCGDAP